MKSPTLFNQMLKVMQTKRISRLPSRYVFSHQLLSIGTRSFLMASELHGTSDIVQLDIMFIAEGRHRKNNINRLHIAY